MLNANKTASELSEAVLLLDINLALFVFLLCFGFLGDGDMEDTLIHTGLDFAPLHILGQKHRLLELRVGELTTQVVALLILLIVLAVVLTVVFEANHEVVLVIQMYREILLAHTGCCHLHDVLLFVLFDIDCGGDTCTTAIHPLGGKEVAEEGGHPALVASYDCCHNLVICCDKIYLGKALMPPPTMGCGLLEEGAKYVPKRVMPGCVF